jgi:ring-1,2-phenylacetyl-CoA epoxidase subunit PaaC
MTSATCSSTFPLAADLDAAMLGSRSALFTYLLRLGDNALMLGHRLSEWCGHAPVLEEDLALANMGLDLIGQARSFLSYAGEVEARGRDEDALAYLREAGEYRNILLVELPRGDFAFTMVRQLLYAGLTQRLFEALARSRDSALAGIAGKGAKELAYHVRHATEWTIRLGDGTEESHRRTQLALDELWPYTGEMLEIDAVERTLIEQHIAVDPSHVRPEWEQALSEMMRQATLQLPSHTWMQSGGRIGRHTEHLGHILSDLQYLQRTYPGAKW